MPQPRLAMRKIREILRERFENGLPHREIATSCRISPSTVGDCLRRFRLSGLTWPLDLSDDELEKLLYCTEPTPPDAERPEPDWEYVFRELRRRDVHVTRSLLWEEYVRDNPNAYSYSWFCQRFEEWRAKVEPVMRQAHRFGEKCFVDFAGDLVPIVDPKTGEVESLPIFVGVLGASNYTYAEVCPNQSLAAWIGAHIRMFEFFGGCPEILVPDNTKCAVKKPCYYEPDVNLIYEEMAKYYGVAVVPARVRRPKDKAKVENGVLVVEREVLAPLRHRTFYSRAEAMEAIYELLDRLNSRPFQKLSGSRQELLDAHEKPNLKPLPASPFPFAGWKPARVHPDYHVEVDRHFYSVPHALVREQVEVRLTASVVEVLHRGRRVASHRRSYKEGGFTTSKEHMPAKHRWKADWTPARLAAWASSVGPSTRQLATGIMERRQHPEQAVRSLFGLLKLGERFGRARLEAACDRALHLGAFQYKSVKSILEKELDRQPLHGKVATRRIGHHENVRGRDYYSKKEGELC
jgi:transposase